MFGTNLTGCTIFYVATLSEKITSRCLNNAGSWPALKIMFQQLQDGTQEAILSPGPGDSAMGPRPHFEKH